jgi:hypothetical protein
MAASGFTSEYRQYEIICRRLFELQSKLSIHVEPRIIDHPWQVLLSYRGQSVEVTN